MGEKTKRLKIGNIEIGGGAPVTIQSMTNTDTRNAAVTAEQINTLAKNGCDIVRVAVPDETAANAITEIKKMISVPLVADIHFDWRLAVLSAKNGCDKLRINPGNIGNTERVKSVADACGERKIPIRIGVNSGSLEKDIEEKLGHSPEALVESALRNILLLENLGFYDIVISIKSSSVKTTIAAYRLLSKQTDYPLHIGVTEAGTPYSGIIKSAIGIGSLLADGIGDTLRVSLTGDPVNEVKCAKEILKALELRKCGIEFISCPTCGRTEIDLVSIAEEVERRCSGINKNIKVAVMGCVVNGPGEAKHANIGIAGGNNSGVIFKDGVVIRKVSAGQLADELMKEIENY
ncbi:MAG: flavodoxin-dependent (E)-4-hydroxy-3-methylbut-2-enyl-diphosphate synthase [Clostridiales bacterium]|jgi:(E)-4-hydroxy-3-methylbut-2-enyl-diphosphate synthase|nr:flavodoxin-dependent (E)-4-hydroxy-3-methylbut-2-enyl-diphosphate synthase [Clostridiales bacterium]